MTSLASSLVAAANRHAGRVALRLDDHVLRYAELLGCADDVARRLRAANVKPGDRVAVSIPNLPAFPAAFYGALLAGAVVVPMNPQLKRREIEHYLTDSGAEVVLTIPGADELSTTAAALGVAVMELDPLVRSAPVDPSAVAIEDVDDLATAVILYTSGTTGRSKGAELTHRNLNTNTRTVLETVTCVTDSDVVMGCLPLFHCFGLVCGLTGAVAAGACLTLLPRFDAGHALHIIERDRVTVFEGVPTMYVAMLRHSAAGTADLSSLRTCITGGSAMPMEILNAFETTFSCEVLEGYGLSETSPVACFNRVGMVRKPGTVGLPIAGCTIRIVDTEGRDVPTGQPGEIAIQGVNVMKGYWTQPQATAEAIPDGWFRTGDIGIFDSDGYLSIVDRKKDMILRGGYNVYPREIEEVLYEHPCVSEAAVVGVPEPSLGEEVTAVVVLKEGAAATCEEIREFVRDRVAAYKYPRRVEIVPALPKGPTGKILRREVRELRL